MGFGGSAYGGAAFGGGGANPVDLTPPVITNLSPADMSEVDRFTNITFDAIDVGSGIQKVFIWVKTEQESRTVMIYDGDTFLYPYVAESTVVALNATTLRFSLRPTGGWVYNITKLTVRVVDEQGNFDVV